MLLRYSSIGGELQLGRESSEVTSLYSCLESRRCIFPCMLNPDTQRLAHRYRFGAHSRPTSMSGSEVSGRARRHGCARPPEPAPNL